MPLPATTTPAPSGPQGRSAFGAGTDAAVERLPVGPNFPSVLVFFDQYEVDTRGGDPVVLPVFVHRPLKPGVAGIRAQRKSDRSHEDGWRGAMNADAAKGGRWVMPGSGPGRYDYHKVFDCQHPSTGRLGTHTVFNWMSPRMVRGVGLRWDVDHTARREFAVQLMADGLIPAPEKDHLEPLLSRAHAKLERIETTGDITDTQRAKQLEVARAELAAIEAAIAKSLGEDVNAPKKAAGKRATAAGKGGAE